MAGIYERVTSSGEGGPAKLPVHPFVAALRELSRGNVTKADVVATFSLDSEAETELQALIDQYNSLSKQDQDNYIMQFHDALLLAEAGHYTKTKTKNVLGF